jgi:uncharacterized membrane protein
MENVKSNFTDFGKSFKIVAIMTIFETFVIIPVFNLVSLIFILKALKSLTAANDTIQNEDLKVYISKFKTATILRFILSFFIIPVTVFPSLNQGGFRWIFFIPTASLFLIMLIMRIIAGVIERNAWQRFSKFCVSQQKNYAYLYIGQNASDKLENAALCEILSFLLIPIFIGWIFRLIGYFKLANYEDIPSGKGEQPKESESVQTPSQTPEKSQETQEVIPEKGAYCPFCGDKIRKGATFCPSCGTKLTQKKKD